MDADDDEGSELPEFSDVKIFIDSLLVYYQTDRNVTFEIERSPMRCTPYHRDFMFGKKTINIGVILSLDFRRWISCYNNVSDGD